MEQLSDTSPQNLPEHQTCGLVQQKKMRRFRGKLMHFFAENPKSPFPLPHLNVLLPTLVHLQAQTFSCGAGKIKT